nr:hypothetical protein [Tanacetum cinerariifolium]
MAPKRTIRANLATTTTTTTTSMTDAQLEALIEQGVVKALAAHDADENKNGDDSHVSGTGIVELTQWFEKMETVFRISNCSMENQFMFSTSTLLGSALTWWNSHIMTVGHDTMNKRKQGDNNNQALQQPLKKQGVAIAYTTGPGEMKENQGHYRSNCLELKNQDHGNQARGTRAYGMAHALEGGETNQDLNDVEDDINA